MTERPDEPDLSQPPDEAQPDADIEAALTSEAEDVVEPEVEHAVEPEVDESSDEAAPEQDVAGPEVTDEVEEPVAEEPAVEEAAVETEAADEVEEPVAEESAEPEVADEVEEPVAEEPAEPEVADEVEEPAVEEAIVEEPVAVPAGAFDPDGDDISPDTDVLAAAAAEPATQPATEDDDEGGSHIGRNVLLGVLGLVAALYVAGYFLTGARMPANATIGGVDVSGMSPSAARAAVDEALTPRIANEIVLSHEKVEFRVKPADAGLSFDLDRSVDEAGGHRSWNPKDMVGLLFGDHETAPALDVDDAKLQSVIGTIGESINVEVVEAQITFPKAKPTPREPKAGLVVARDDAADVIKDAYLVTDKPVKVPTVVVEPAVDSDGLADAMKTIAEPAVAGPVTLAVGDKNVSLPVTAYTPALVVQVQDNVLKPYIDPKKLAEPLTSSVTGIGKKAVDATVKIENGKPVVVPGKEGVGLQPEEMAQKLLPVLDKTGAERKIAITAKVVDPLFTTEDAKALKITERISSFTTRFPYAEYRNINQGRAAELINGTIIEPGETFSFNKTVGERTVANGFVTGTVINGGVFREELGGGVSQVATTTYNAAFFGGMDDVEHHPHAFYINRYPVGREATVYFGNLDLRWKNSTKYGVLVRAWVVKSTPGSQGQMHVELWSTKVYDVKAGQSARRNFRSPGTQYDDTKRCVPQDPIQGFDIDIYRTFYQGGKKVKSETDTAHYQAADHVICGKKPD
ncbi:VanW family protein [Aeromicrobium panaciterrae]|uniref:VanW family protein n=1 Tax=Aeromicrobium panaciterrae TaxID=363861 RepID=UPI0031D6432C